MKINFDARFLIFLNLSTFFIITILFVTSTIALSVTAFSQRAARRIKGNTILVFFTFLSKDSTVTIVLSTLIFIRAAIPITILLKCLEWAIALLRSEGNQYKKNYQHKNK